MRLPTRREEGFHVTSKEPSISPQPGCQIASTDDPGTLCGPCGWCRAEGPLRLA